MAKQERTVIHVQFKKQHFYFGSLAALYEVFSKDDIGISYGSLRNYGLCEDKPYHNDKVTIRKGTLYAIAQKHPNPDNTRRKKKVVEVSD